MGAINHYSYIHTIGQGKLQGFGLKTARIFSLSNSNERSAAAEVQKNTTKLLYAVAHPVAKRNMLFILDNKIKNLHAAWVPGIPRPAHSNALSWLM